MGNVGRQHHRRVPARNALHVFSDRSLPDPWLRSTITIGFLGAYTTFSTFSLESYRLFSDGAVGLAAANALGSVAGGLTAVYLGVVAGRAF